VAVGDDLGAFREADDGPHVLGAATREQLVERE
jgi:hypothetical protein